MVCLDNKKNLGVGRCSDLPGMIRGMITTPASWRVTEVMAALKTTWQTAIVAAKSQRVYLWPLFSDVPEYIGTETTYQENPVAYLHLLDGRYRWRVSISKSLCFHKAAYTHRSSSDRVWLIDDKNNLIGTYVEDNVSGEAVLAGFTLDLLHTENLVFNDGSIATRSPIVVALKDPNEVNHDVYGAVMIAAPWLSSLSALTDVEFDQQDAGSATEFSMLVRVACDSTPISGLEAGDFVLTDEDGTPHAFTVEETEDGVYVFTGIGFENDMVVTLAGPADLSVYPDAAYDGVDKDVTVPS